MNVSVPGPVAPGGNTPAKMGSWGLRKPVLKGRCSFCLLCWVFCPDGVIYKEQGNKLRFDYRSCKGCGICSRECPLKSIEMVELVEER